MHIVLNWILVINHCTYKMLRLYQPYKDYFVTYLFILLLVGWTNYFQKYNYSHRYLLIIIILIILTLYLVSISLIIYRDI